MYRTGLKKKNIRRGCSRLDGTVSIQIHHAGSQITKIVLNQGVGGAVADKRLIDTAQTEMSTIAGQKAVPTKSKKDISNFKLRKGVNVGVRVTLRGERMYEFLDRLSAISLPPVSVTSKVLTPKVSTAAATTTSASPSKSSSRRSISTRWTKSTVWTLHL